MARREGWSGLLLLVLGVLILGQSVRLSLGTLAEPGPGLFPGLLGLCLAALAALLVFRRTHSPTDADAAATPAGYRRVVALAVGIVAYPALLEHAGFLLTTWGTMAFFFRTSGIRGWLKSGAFAAVVSAASYGLFDVLLGLRLPVGVWSR